MKCIIILIYSSVISCDGTHKNHKITFQTLNLCKNLDLPLVTPLPYDLQIELYNNTQGINLIRGQIKFPRDLSARSLRGTFAYGIDTSSGTKWLMRIKDFDCNSFVVKAILRGFGVPIKGCMVKKGVYKIKEVDPNAIESDLFPTGGTAMPRGKYTARLIINSKNETFGCWQAGFKLEHPHTRRYK